MTGKTYGAIPMFVSPVLTNIKGFSCITAIVFPGLYCKNGEENPTIKGPFDTDLGKLYIANLHQNSVVDGTMLM